MGTMKQNVDRAPFYQITEMVRHWIKQCPNCMHPQPESAVLGDRCCNCNVQMYMCYVCFRLPDSDKKTGQKNPPATGQFEIPGSVEKGGQSLN